MHSLTKKQVAAYLYVTFCFLHTLQFHTLKLPLYGNLLSFTVIYVAIICTPIIKKEFLPQIICVISIYLLYIPDPERSSEQLLLLAYYVTIICFANFISISDLYLAFQKVTLPYVWLSIFLYYLGVGVESGYGSNRMHGLLSEPSAFTFVILFLFVNSIIRRNALQLVTAAVGSIYANSLTLYVSLFIATAMIVFIKAPSYLKVFITLVTLILIMIIISVFSNITNFSDNENLIRMASGIQYITSMGDAGHNPRGQALFNAIDYSQKYGFYLGQGIDAGGKYAYDLDTLRDLNFWLEILLSFGITGVTIFLAYTLTIIISLKKFWSDEYAVLFISSLIYSSINSAQGIVFSQFFVISLLNWHRHKKVISSQIS